MTLATQEVLTQMPAAPALSTLTIDDGRIVCHADKTIADGVELERWFESKSWNPEDPNCFNVIREFNSEGSSFGFFDRAPVGGRMLPVMGIVQEMFYDRQKSATGRAILPQLREFILHYFMRVSDVRRPEALAEGHPTPPSYLRPFAWNPDESDTRIGFGYQQVYYKRRGGDVGKFPAEEQPTIVDLREIGTLYDWIVLKCDIFDFNLAFAPFGSSAPKMLYPMKEQTYLVLGPEFVRNRENCAPGVLAEYGYGYGFMPCVPDGAPSFIAYGPGHFAAAYQSLHFRLMESGDIRVRAVFIVNRPEKVAKVDIDPIDWSFRLADLMTFNMASRIMAPMREAAERLPLRITGVDPIGAYITFANFISGGRAATELGHSMNVLEKRMLVQHFMQHYEMLTNSLMTWRKIPDWTDEANIPEYCRKGICC